LARKLGFKEESRVLLLGAPEDYHRLFDTLPDGIEFETRPSERVDIVHVFETDRAALASTLGALRQQLNPAASVWVSWPKKASKVATTITEDVIRELALPLGFVDIKVCAVNEVWSGLKLVVRKALRT
jgi:hypothetical protein